MLALQLVQCRDYSRGSRVAHAWKERQWCRADMCSHLLCVLWQLVWPALVGTPNNDDAVLTCSAAHSLQLAAAAAACTASDEVFGRHLHTPVTHLKLAKG